MATSRVSPGSIESVLDALDTTAPSRGTRSSVRDERRAADAALARTLNRRRPPAARPSSAYGCPVSEIAGADRRVCVSARRQRCVD